MRIGDIYIALEKLFINSWNTIRNASSSSARVIYGFSFQRRQLQLGLIECKHTFFIRVFPASLQSSDNRQDGKKEKAF